MYEKELKVAIDSALKAGKILMNYHNSEVEIFKKKDGSSVTIADKESNEFISKNLLKEFPNDGIISEELAEIKGIRKWHVDPLDGTRSYLEKSNDFSIHIGLCVDDKPVLGVVYEPAKDELFYAVRGQGAFFIKNGKKTKLKTNYDSGKKIIAIVSTRKEKTNIDKNFISSLKFFSINEIVQCGSIGGRMMEIAKGNADLHIPLTKRHFSWDYCAPNIIVEEAGGKVSFEDGNDIIFDNPSFGEGKLIIVASSKELLKIILDKLKQHPLIL